MADNPVYVSPARPARKARKAPVVSETAEHLTIAAYFRKIGLGGNAIAIHLRGERHGDMQRIMAARMGVVAGLPDWMFIDCSKVGFIELKPRGWTERTQRTGTYTIHEQRQRDMHARLRRAGAWVVVAETLDVVLITLRYYGVPLRSESLSTELIRKGITKELSDAP